MRRNEREVTDFKEKIEIIRKCDVCRIALFDKEYPYIVPVNFGWKAEGGQVTLYFHGAAEGKKIELLKENPKAGFEMDCGHELVIAGDSSGATMHYESVCGTGVIEAVAGEERNTALSSIMKQYCGEGSYTFPEKLVDKMGIFKLVVREMTAKRNR